MEEFEYKYVQLSCMLEGEKKNFDTFSYLDWILNWVQLQSWINVRVKEMFNKML